VAAVTVNVLGRSPRGQQWCRATVYASLTFVIGGPQGVTWCGRLVSERFRSAPSGGPLPGRLLMCQNRLRPAVPTCYDRRRHPWEGALHVRHEAGDNSSRWPVAQ
jgi:hypothetical protein